MQKLDDESSEDFTQPHTPAAKRRQRQMVEAKGGRICNVRREGGVSGETAVALLAGLGEAGRSTVVGRLGLAKERARGDCLKVRAAQLAIGEGEDEGMETLVAAALEALCGDLGAEMLWLLTEVADVIGDLAVRGESLGFGPVGRALLAAAARQGAAGQRALRGLRDGVGGWSPQFHEQVHGALIAMLYGKGEEGKEEASDVEQE